MHYSDVSYGSYSRLGVVCGELEGVLADSLDVRQQACIWDDVPRQSESYIAVAPGN